MSFTVIPAIDLIDGKCVRLSQGNYASKTVYSADPAAVATQFEDAGFTQLHLVDLDGAKAGSIKNLNVLEAIASSTKLKIDFGGGVKTLADAQSVICAGASWVTVGSIANKAPGQLQEMIATIGAEKFFIGADVKQEHIAVHGWQEISTQHINDFIAYWQAQGLQRFFCTDIETDGMLQGPGIALYTALLQRFPGLNLTASGGVATIEHVQALKHLGCSGVIVGKAIYEERISLQELVALNS